MCGCSRRFCNTTSTLFRSGRATCRTSTFSRRLVGSAYRNVLDVTAIPVMKRETHLPVIVDPSHAGGKAWMVPALSCAAVAAGADGLLIEIHPNPCEALCDADQALTLAEFGTLMGTL